MGKEKAGPLTPKAIANRIKAKGLQKLRWYCQMCQKQCRDEVIKACDLFMIDFIDHFAFEDSQVIYSLGLSSDLFKITFNRIYVATCLCSSFNSKLQSRSSV